MGVNLGAVKVMGACVGAVGVNSETVTCDSGGSSVRGGCPAPWGLRTAATEGGGVLEAGDFIYCHRGRNRHDCILKSHIKP